LDRLPGKSAKPKNPYKVCKSCRHRCLKKCWKNKY
jgi:hypothetical protein